MGSADCFSGLSFVFIKRVVSTLRSATADTSLLLPARPHPHYFASSLISGVYMPSKWSLCQNKHACIVAS
jgi:hypothetical protein